MRNKIPLGPFLALLFLTTSVLELYMLTTRMGVHHTGYQPTDLADSQCGERMDRQCFDSALRDKNR